MQLKINGSHMRNAQKNAGEDGARSVTAYVRRLIEIDTAKRQGRFSRHIDPLKIEEFLELAISAAGKGKVAIMASSKALGVRPYIGSMTVQGESESDTLLIEVGIQEAREMLRKDVEGQR